MEKKIMIAPSLLSANFTDIAEDIRKMENAGADLFHCDVMDGLFVPNITFGAKMVADIKKVTSLPLDVHLMIVNPERYVEQFALSGADYITFHIEACSCVRETLQKIRALGVKCGLVIKPNTPISSVKEYVKDCDILLLMSVEPGFGGQKFIPASLERLKELTRLCASENASPLIEIDGGITESNIDDVLACGATVIVAGNTIFGSIMPQRTITRLRGAL